MYIKINIHNSNLPVAHGDWMDLYTAEEITMKEGEFKLISLGVSMEIPENHYAIIAPRSSTFKNYGILQANSIGIIDNDYSGNDDVWKFPAYATKDITIPANTRICQFTILKNTMNQVDFIQCKLENKNRGGFGTTGK